MFDKQLKTVEDVNAFFLYLLQEEKVNFHPDDDFADYVNLETGTATFNKNQIQHYNKLMNDAFSVCNQANIDIYDLACRVLNSIDTSMN